MNQKIVKFMNMKWFPVFFVCSLFFVGMYLLPGRILGSDFDGVPGDFGDARLNNFFLEHGYQYFTGKTSSYWSAPFMYPDKRTLTYSDNLLGTLPLYIFFRLLSFDRETSFQLWFLLICALNFISAFLCFKKLKFNLYLSAIGAYIFAFSLTFIAQIGHVQMIAIFCIPWIFYYLIRFFNSWDAKHLGFSFLGLVWLFYCGMYLGFLTALLVSIVFILNTLLKFNTFKNKLSQKLFLRQICLCILLPVLILIPLIIPYFQRATSTGYKDYKDVIPLLLTFRNFLMPTGEPWIWKKLIVLNQDVAFAWEKQLWCGGLLFGFFFYYLLKRFTGKWHSKGISFILISSLIVSILIFVNWGLGFSFFKYIRHLPGYSSMKPIGRIIIPQLFLMIWVLLYILRAIMIKYYKHKWIYLVLACFAILDHGITAKSMLRYSKSTSQQRINEIIKKIGVHSDSTNHQIKAIAYIPNSTENPVHIQIEGALAAQQLMTPSVNGYSSTCQTDFGPFWENHDSVTLLRWLNANQLEIVKDGILIVR